MFPNKFVIMWDNEPVGLDSNSGGYPSKVSHPSLVKYYNTREEAEAYIKIFENSLCYGFYIPRVRIVEIQFRIMYNN